MTRALQILKLMATCETMTAERASVEFDCELKLAQNTLCFMVRRGFIRVESCSKRFLPATYRITSSGLMRAEFTPKTKGEPVSARSERRTRWTLRAEADRDAMDRQKAEERAKEAVAHAMARAIPNSVFALGNVHA